MVTDTCTVTKVLAWSPGILAAWWRLDLSEERPNRPSEERKKVKVFDRSSLVKDPDAIIITRHHLPFTHTPSYVKQTGWVFYTIQSPFKKDKQGLPITTSTEWPRRSPTSHQTRHIRSYAKNTLWRGPIPGSNMDPQVRHFYPPHSHHRNVHLWLLPSPLPNSAIVRAVFHRWRGLHFSGGRGWALTSAPSRSEVSARQRVMFSWLNETKKKGENRQVKVVNRSLVHAQRIFWFSNWTQTFSLHGMRQVNGSEGLSREIVRVLREENGKSIKFPCVCCFVLLTRYWGI